MIKKVMVLILIVSLLFGLSVYAEDDKLPETQEVESGFEDVTEDDWFYDAVMTMHRYGIIVGYEDGTFRPNESVSRAQFATMMVKALQLETSDAKSSFVDVADGYWAKKYIEAAKPYLTGFVKNGEYRFKPEDVAVREDMAVALVRALEKPINEEQLIVLDDYADKDDISENLKTYMASAIANNLMEGVVAEDGTKYIQPMETLTRSQAAALLLNVVNEEKIVFDDETKVVLNESDLTLEMVAVEGGVKLDWSYKGFDEPTGYKVVASLNNENPSYPEDGNAKYVQGKSVAVYNNDSYNGGDFEVFKAEETYYFSITALVGEQYITSNVIKMTMPAAVSIEGKVPNVRVSKAGDGLVVEWNAIDKNGLQGYKVVASKADETPVYPDDGYASWITNLDTLSYYVQPGTVYNGGDVAPKFKAGETYYFSVTAIYNSGKIAGNTVKFIMPGEPVEEISIEDRTPTVEATVADGKLLIEWSEIDLSGLQGYKVVASKSNAAPIYPEDGYAFWITDKSIRSKEIAPGTKYNGGDLEGEFKSGETYYVSVTAVYSDKKIPGNSVKIEMP